jgi:hypothetical protein
MNIRRVFSYPRAVDTAIGPCPLRRLVMKASASAGVHCHG